MNTRQEKLIAKVAAVNLANAEATRLHQILYEIFSSLVGQKILRADGELRVDVRKLLPELSNDTRLMYYRSRSGFVLAYKVKSCEPLPPHSCIYHEATVEIGVYGADGTTLKQMYPVKTYRSDYVVEEVELKRQAYTSANRLANELHCDLFPFGESDS